jgi:hypothetical protein
LNSSFKLLPDSSGFLEDHRQGPVFVCEINPIVDYLDFLGKRRMVGWAFPTPGHFQPSQITLPPGDEVSQDIFEAPLSHHARLRHSFLADFSQEGFPAAPFLPDTFNQLLLVLHSFSPKIILVLAKL